MFSDRIDFVQHQKLKNTFFKIITRQLPTTKNKWLTQSDVWMRKSETILNNFGNILNLVIEKYQFLYF